MAIKVFDDWSHVWTFRSTGRDIPSIPALKSAQFAMEPDLFLGYSSQHFSVMI
jgi:hypothetical protein